MKKFAKGGHRCDLTADGKLYTIMVYPRLKVNTIVVSALGLPRGPEMRRHKPIRQINLRITEQLRRKLEAAAAERQISTNQLMVQLLEEGLDNKAEKWADAVARELVKKLGLVPPPGGGLRPSYISDAWALSQQGKKDEGDAEAPASADEANKFENNPQDRS